MSLLEHLSSPVFARLVITLMHFLWQGTVIALMALITAALIGRRSSNARYLVHVSGLFAMVLCLGVTFLIVKTPVEPLTQKSSPSIAVLPKRTHSLKSQAMYRISNLWTSQVKLPSKQSLNLSFRRKLKSPRMSLILPSTSFL